MQQRGRCQHDALGAARGARCRDDERDVVAVERAGWAIRLQSVDDRGLRAWLRRKGQHCRARTVERGRECCHQLGRIDDTQTTHDQ